MPIEITMPQLSDTMTEGTVVSWKKKEGDVVKSGEEIADIETDKATMPMEAFDDGTIAAILIAEGDKVSVGQVLAVLAAKGEDVGEIKRKYAAGGGAGKAQPEAKAAEPKAQPAKPQAKPAKPEAKPAEPTEPAAPDRAEAADSGTEPGAEGSTRPAESEDAARKQAPQPTPAQQPQEARQPSAASEVPAAGQPSERPEGERAIVSPLARRMAAEMGIDLSDIQGSGPGGRIVQKDVESAATNKAAAPAAKPSAPGPAAPAKPAPAPMAPRVSTGQQQVVPLTKMRATIAQRLQASTQNLPHFYESIDINCEAVMELRGKLNSMLEKEAIRLSLADFIAKALAVALLEHPGVNATFDGQQVTMHGDVNLGMAVALPNGLIVPVLRGVNQMGLKEIRQRTADLIDRARQQKLKAEELSGGTFTISNLGNFGIREFTAIINPPEVAILAIGSAEKRPVVEGDQVVARTMMTVTLSSDHRVVDGAAAAEFLRTFKHLMEEPGMMLV